MAASWRRAAPLRGAASPGARAAGRRVLPRHARAAPRARAAGAAGVALAPDEAALAACTAALERALQRVGAGGVRFSVVGVLVRGPPAARTGAPPPAGEGAEVHLERLAPSGSARGSQAFALHAPTAAAAASVACSPGGGLVASLGMRPALCVCGPWREPALGADAGRGGAQQAARAAALMGVPAVAAGVPTKDTRLDLQGATEAIEVAAGHAMRLLVASGEGAAGAGTMRHNTAAAGAAPNWPRAHFPFPTQGRWADLGGAQLPCDEALTRSIAAEAAAGSDGFAVADCWSLGGGTALSMPTQDEVRAAVLSPAERRAVLARAFKDGDVYVAIQAPTRWRASAGGRFAPARPGVLWHQEQVEAVYGSAEGVGAGVGDGRYTNPHQARDLYGRSLPLHTTDAVSPTSDGARFVPQLNSAQVAADVRGGVGGVGVGGAAAAAAADSALPTAFRLGAGTMLVDASARGDVDAVLAGRCAVSTCQVWPHGHPLSLLDAVMTEALREADGQAGQGMPAWLLSAQESDAPHIGGSAATPTAGPKDVGSTYAW